MTELLDGRPLARTLHARTAETVAALRAEGVEPTLALVLATGDESAAWYVRSLTRAAERVGIAARTVQPGPAATEAQIAAALAELGRDPTVHGILLQTPLPAGVRLQELTPLIPVAKDVDGVNPLSAGRLATGLPAFAPATAEAVLELLREYGVTLRGARVVVLGRSLVVGKPLLQLLLAEDATVTVCHSRTLDLASVARCADVLVAAIGRPRFVGAEHVRDGMTVVDVGTTPDETGNLVGDVDAEAVTGVVAALSPVPGGVGPVTTALLLRNTAVAAGDHSHH